MTLNEAETHAQFATAEPAVNSPKETPSVHTGPEIEKTEWTKGVMSDFFHMYQPKTISGKDMQSDGAYVVYGANGPIGRYSSYNHEESEVTVTCRGATCGTVNVTPPKVWITGNAMIVRPKINGLSKEFTAVALRHMGFEKAITGAAQPQITRTSLDSIPFQFPDVDEQKRIVAKLYEAQGHLLSLQSILVQSTKNEAAFASSVIEQICGDGFEQTNLTDLCEVITDGDHQPPPKSTSGVPFVTISSIDKQRHLIDFDKAFRVSAEYFEAIKETRKPRRGDVLYTVTGSFGIPVLVQDDRDFCFQRHIALIRAQPELDPGWLYYLLQGRNLQAQAEDQATGAAQRTVTLKSLRAFKIPMVPVAEQRRMVKRIERLLAAKEYRSALLSQKVQHLNAFRDQLFSSAFASEL